MKVLIFEDNINVVKDLKQVMALLHTDVVLCSWNVFNKIDKTKYPDKKFLFVDKNGTCSLSFYKKFLPNALLFVDAEYFDFANKAGLFNPNCDVVINVHKQTKNKKSDSVAVKAKDLLLKISKIKNR